MAHSDEAVKILVQCDFDGTIAVEDVSFLLLDAFADSSWRQLLTDYRDGKISVGDFNAMAFAMIKPDKQALLDFLDGRMEIRPGFGELLTYCKRMGFQFVVVSNGLDFYIEKILKDNGVDNLEVLAARTRFDSKGIEVNYIGPDGAEVRDDFKGVHIRRFLSMGYQVIYVGNGLSDLKPAGQAHHIFATGDLVDLCRRANLNYTPFADLHDVVKGMELLEQERGHSLRA